MLAVGPDPTRAGISRLVNARYQCVVCDPYGALSRGERRRLDWGPRVWWSVVGASHVAYGGVALIGCAALVVGQIGSLGTPAAEPRRHDHRTGNVYADGAVLGVIPQDSGLSLTTAAGQANAAYSETEAQATSATVNLGGLGVLLAGSGFCSSPACPSANSRSCSRPTASRATSTGPSVATWLTPAPSR